MAVATSTILSDARGQCHGDAAATTVVIHFVHIYLYTLRKNFQVQDSRSTTTTTTLTFSVVSTTHHHLQLQRHSNDVHRQPQRRHHPQHLAITTMTSLASPALSANNDDDDEPLVTAAIPSPSVDDGDPTPSFSMDDDDRGPPSPSLFQGNEDSSHLYPQPSSTTTAITPGFTRRQLPSGLASPDGNDIPNLNLAQ